MNLKHAILAVGLSAVCTFASTDLTLVPTQTNGFERNFNPFDAAVGSFYATDFVYEPLWIFNVWHPDKNYPRLADSVDIAADYQSVTYHIRDGVTWSDGKPFTAEDVAFTVNYARQHPDFDINIDLYNPQTQSGLVTRVETQPGNLITFHLSAPNAMAHQSIGGLYPLPKHIFDAIDDPANFANMNPVGTGPFTEVTFKTTHFKLCRNPNYYQARDLKVECLKVPNYSGNEQLWAAARRGKIDWMGLGMNDPENQFLKHAATNKVWLAPGAATLLQVNTRKAPLDNAEVRKALSLAIDRNQLLTKDTFGLTSPMNWPVATGPLYGSWYNKSELAPYAGLMNFNPTQSEALLDNAGLVDRDNDGWRDLPDGNAFEIGVAVPSGWTDWFNSVLTIVENFRAVGINAKVEAMDVHKWYERMPTGDFDLYMMWTNPGITPWKIYSELFNQSDMNAGQLSAQAMHQFRSDDISRWLQDFTLTDNPLEQRQLMANIQKVVADNQPVVSLFANPIWYQYSNERFTGWVTEADPYVRPQVHRGVPERLIHVLNLRPKE
jgi:peptide/nickel transport system substrate-binding protein